MVRASKVQGRGHEVYEREVEKKWAINETIHGLQQLEEEGESVVVLHHAEAKGSKMLPHICRRPEPYLTKSSGPATYLLCSLLDVLKPHPL